LQQQGHKNKTDTPDNPDFSVVRCVIPEVSGNERVDQRNRTFKPDGKKSEKNGGNQEMADENERREHQNDQKTQKDDCPAMGALLVHTGTDQNRYGKTGRFKTAHEYTDFSYRVTEG